MGRKPLGENTMFMTTYFDTRKNFCEVVFSKKGPNVPAGCEPTKESIKNYVDIVCPVEFRTVNGRDTLAITKLSRDIDISMVDASEINTSDMNGGDVKPYGFKMKY